MLDFFTTSKLFAFGILLIQIDILVLVVSALVAPQGYVTKIAKKYALPVIIFASGMSIVGSLTFSEIFVLAPCKLCWFQRIFLYPSFFLGLVGWYTKDRKVFRYILTLSVVGVIIALYHYILQMTGISLIPCSAIGQSDACSGTYVKEFGYITIPMMSLTLYIYVIVLSWLGLKKDADTIKSEALK